jgi:hypothetical protein
MKIYIASIILALYCALILKVIDQQKQIIELQKDRHKFTMAMDYIALKAGIESGDQFPVIGSDWFKCVRVDTR